jgi:hypothetical protein
MDLADEILAHLKGPGDTLLLFHIGDTWYVQAAKQSSRGWKRFKEDGPDRDACLLKVKKSLQR